MSVEQRKAVYLVQGQKIIYSKKDSYSGSLITNTLGVYEFEFRTDSEWTEFDKVALYLQATGVQPTYIELTNTDIATCTTDEAGNKIYTVPVPEQMLTKAGQLTVGLIGYYSNQDDFRFPTNTDSSYRIAASVQPLDGKQYPQYISIMEQILLRLYKGQGGSTEDLTELRRQVAELNQLLVKNGDGTQFLSNDGNYHTVTGYDDTQLSNRVKHLEDNSITSDQVETIAGNKVESFGIQGGTNDGFYIVDKDGNIIFKIDAAGVNFVGLSELKGPKSPYKGMKMISIGDSLSAHDKWQKWLVEWLGITFDLDENINGKDGHACMSKGGTAVFPNSTDSIYMRALDAHYYNPDIIFIYAGQNDINHFAGETDVNTASLGTIDDKPYLLDKIYTEATDEEKATYTSWYEGRPTIYSGFKGLIQRVMESNKSARVFILTGIPNYESTGVQATGRPLVVKAWKEIGELYKVKVIDAWNTGGINEFNADAYYPNAGNVHNTDEGYKRYAEIIYREV